MILKPPPIADKMLWKVRNSTVWRSFWRQGYPNNDENRALIMFNSLFLHLHPDRKSTRLNSSHIQKSRMPSSA